MEKKNPNIYQRALDIVNNRINPDIPQGGGGGSSDAVQYIPQELTEAQQMQARKNQGLYYEEDTVGYLLEETTLTLGEDDEYIGLPFVVPIVEGENYILVRDGVEYDVTATPYYGVYVYVGYPPEEEPAEGDPKVCIISSESLGGTMIRDLEIGTHTYAIKGAMHVLSAIDKKYVRPVIDDYMTLIEPRQELIINWDGDMSEREKIWDDDRGWVKIADDFPDDAIWISLTTMKYGTLDEPGSWTTTNVQPGSDMDVFGNIYVLGEWNLIFVGSESFTSPEIGCTLTHGVWTAARSYDDYLVAYHEIVFPGINAPVPRFAGGQGVGKQSFICAYGSAGTTSGQGAINGGYRCEVSGDYSTAFGWRNTVLGNESFATGWGNTAKGLFSTAEGDSNIAGGRCSHVEGAENESEFDYQHIEGKYSEKYDTENVPEWNARETYYPGDVVFYDRGGNKELRYCIKQCTNKSPGGSDGGYYWAPNYNPLVHVVGWGNNSSIRKNIHTIDSLGNAMYTGDVTAKSMIIQSSTPDSTKKFKITVDDTGAIPATEVT